MLTTANTGPWQQVIIFHLLINLYALMYSSKSIMDTRYKRDLRQEAKSTVVPIPNLLTYSLLGCKAAYFSRQAPKIYRRLLRPSSGLSTLKMDVVSLMHINCTVGHHIPEDHHRTFTAMRISNLIQYAPYTSKMYSDINVLIFSENYSTTRL
jgi:hypothetical protein